MTLQRLVERTLRDVGKDLVLSFICCAVGDPGDGGGGEERRAAARLEPQLKMLAEERKHLANLAPGGQRHL